MNKQTLEQAEKLFLDVRSAQDREFAIGLIYSALQYQKDEYAEKIFALAHRNGAIIHGLETRIQQMRAVIQVARSELRDLPASATAVAIDDAFADLLGEPRVDAPKRTDWGI